MIDEKADEFQALAYLYRMHRDEARTLGAPEKHFEDVTAYLNEVRSNNPPKAKRSACPIPDNA